MAYSMSFVPAVGINFASQVGYYFLMNKFMYRKNVKLFFFPRVLAAYALIHVAHEEIYIKKYLANSYKVNINDLFDQDEPFLFKSTAFKHLIKRMHDKHVHLINPNFDLSAIV